MRWRLFSFAVALASFSTIGLELELTRIFSVTMYYHFAYMVISIAMLGLSVSGVSIYLFPRLFPERRAPVIAAVFMLLFAGTCLWALKAALESPISLHNWQANLGKLTSLYATAGLTLLSSGFAISLAIATARERIGQVYAFDLVGAALGCVFVIPALSTFGGPGAIVLNAAVAACSALLFALSAGDTAPRSARFGVAAVAGSLAVVLLFAATGEEKQKRFGAARNPDKFLGGRSVEFEKWNSFSQITVAQGMADYKWIFIDADAATRIWSAGAAKNNWAQTRRFGEIRTAALVYAVRHDRPALIIGPGGGTDVISALMNGVPKVVGVEVNPIIVNDIMKGKYGEYSGHLYRDPRVHVVVDEGRSFIRRSGEAYGSIQATLVDTWASSSSGAFTLSENNIYTAEAFEEFLGHLAPGGIVCVTRWYDAGRPKEFLRLLALGREALERRGVAPADVYKHFFLATDRERRGTLLLNRDPFTAADVQALADRAATDRLQILYAPSKPAGALAAPDAGRNTVEEDAFLAGFIRAPSASDFLAKLNYDATATTDDKPFFFYNLFKAEFFSLLGRFRSLEINNLGVAILLLLLVISSALTMLFVVLPLLVFERKSLASDRRAKLRVVGYFLALGGGFILVEMGFMQTFVLFLGHPIYALAVILASLLGASGTGSAISAWGTRRFGLAGYVRRAVALLAVVLVLYALLLTPLFHLLLGLPLPVRIAIAALLVAVPGLLMGALLPSGVRVANSFGPGTVSWGWGLNGAASVVGSIAAMALSMNFGFRMALLVGIAVYVAGTALLPAEKPATSS